MKFSACFASAAALLAIMAFRQDAALHSLLASRSPYLPIRSPGPAAAKTPCAATAADVVTTAFHSFPHGG